MERSTQAQRWITAACQGVCRPLGNCACVAFLFAWKGAAVARPIPLKGGKWHARPARPESSEGLAFSEARGAICASERRCQPRRAGGAWDGLGIQKGRWAAGESLSLHPRPVGREHRTPQGLDKPGQFELHSLFLGRARCESARAHDCPGTARIAQLMMRRLAVRCAHFRSLEVPRGARTAPSGRPRWPLE